MFIHLKHLDLNERLDSNVRLTRFTLDLHDAIQNGKVKIDGGGHNRNTNPTLNFRYFETDDVPTQEQVDELIKAVKGGPAAKTPLNVCSSMDVCYHCNEQIHYKIDGKSIVCTNPCKYPKGYPAFKFKLNVPSGVMIVGNDFRDLYPPDTGERFNINRLHGEIGYTKAYEKAGLAHGYVGNTCPSMFKVGENEFIIGCEGWNEETEQPIPIQKDAKQVASICTDLWWFSIADRDDYKKRGGRLDGRISKVKCVPGIYEFTHRYHLRDYDAYGVPEIYTKIKLKKEYNGR